MSVEDIDNRFKFHPANAEKATWHETVRSDLGALARYFELHLPAGREKSTAITKLEEAMFWANAAIARNS